MKVLLVHTPTDHEVPDSYRTESLGLGYIASVLRRDGHEVEAFDAHLRRLSIRSTTREILKLDFDCLGVTATSAGKRSMIAVVKAVRKARKNALIMAGGYLPTLCPERLFQACPELDLIVRGEGEVTASAVLGLADRGETWRDLPGIAYLDGETPVLNPLPPLISDLNTLPFPARDALRQAKAPTPAGIASSRGCYHRCSFCCIQSFYALSGEHTPRFRSPENVVDEIESVVQETGNRSFRFVDDDFIGPGPKLRARTMALAQEIRRRGLNITFSVEFRPDEVDEEIVTALRDAGLREVFLGVESGVQRQLDTYNKGTTVEQNRRAIEIVRECGVKLRCGFIMFDPYVTTAEMQENIKFVREMGLDKDARAEVAPLVTKLTLYRGVPLEKKLREDGLLIGHGIDIDYKFKDPSARMMMLSAQLFGRLSGLVKSVRRLFGE